MGIAAKNYFRRLFVTIRITIRALAIIHRKKIINGNNFAHRMKNSITVLLLLAGLSAVAQRRVTISGTIKSKSKGETIIGATIRVDGAGGTVSNEYGFYSVNLPVGDHK